MLRLDNFQARYYSGPQGRFTGADGPFNDQSPGDPQSWNLYTYVRNDPLAFTDPDGTACVDSNGNGVPCPNGTEVTVSGSGSSVPYWYDPALWRVLGGITGVVSAALDPLQFAQPLVDAVNTFRKRPNCAAAVTGVSQIALGAAGGYMGADVGAAAGAGLGTLALPGGGTIAGGVAGGGLGGAGGTYLGYTAGGAVGGAVGNVFCNSGTGGSGGKGGEPASESTAQDMAKQIERDLGKDARRVFHDAKEGGVGDRSLAELKAGAKALYDQFGKTPPKWMQ